MFGTWKYDPETDEVQNLRRAYDPVTARASSHQACDRCHEKKLKCSGEKDGCERCLSNKLRCEYTRSGSKSRKGKKGHHKSSKDSPTSSSKESPKSTTSSSSRRTHGSSSGKKHSSSSSSKHHRSHAEPQRTTADEPQGLLSQLDFSMFGPEDAFDLGWLAEEQGAPSSAAYGGYGGLPSHMQAPNPGYHQWNDANQGYPPATTATSSAAMYSQYATATTDFHYGQPSFPQEGYGDFEDYDRQDPHYWSQGGHRQ